MQGITGKLSGKMGAAVFRVREGQQVVTQYNPIVKNPNTTGQQAQRAKFKLMSQLAAVMAPGFGTMGVTERPARGKGTSRNGFVQKNFPLVETESVNDNVTAKIPMEDLKLTDGTKYLGTIAATAEAGEISVEVSDIPAEVSSVRFVVVTYKNAGGAIQPVLQEVIDIPRDSGGNAEYTHSTTAAGEKYTVLAYGLIPTATTGARVDLDNIHVPSDEDFISAVELDMMVRAGEMVETMTIGTNIASV